MRLALLRGLCFVCCGMFAIAPHRAGADVLVSDFTNDQVLRFADDGTLIGLFGDATFAASGLDAPSSIAFDSLGRVYVASLSGIHRYTQQGVFLDKFSTSTRGYEGFAFDSADNLYAAGAGTIQKFDSVGAQSTFATLPTGASDGDIAIDGSDTVYVLVNGTSTDGILHFASSGTAMGIFGDANGTNLPDPRGMARDAGGNFLVQSSPFKKFDSSGDYLGPFGSGLAAIKNLMIAGNGHMFGTDGSENRVYRYDSNGNFTDVFAQAGVAGVSGTFRPEGYGFLNYVPEPGSLSLAALAAAVLMRRRKRTDSA